MNRISKYVSYAEAIKSQTAIRRGILNAPSEIELTNMKHVGTTVVDQVREYIGGPLCISSFFRCAALNAAIGGSRSSQHMSGEAADLDAQVYGGKTNRQIFDYIRLHLQFDQLIWEFGDDQEPDWVHVSKKLSGANRMEILVAYREGGKTRYKPYQP